MSCEKYLIQFRAKTNQVLELFKRFDQQIESIRSNLPSCPYGCRDCCMVPSRNIEASILEFFPLVLHWYDEGVIHQMYEQYKEIADDDVCALLQPDHLILPQGGCTVYKYRPLVCRIFGSSRLVRKNKMDFLACKKLKNEIVEPAILPLATDFHDQLLLIDPYLSTRKHSINEALKRALEYLLNYDYFLSFSQGA